MIKPKEIFLDDKGQLASGVESRVPPPEIALQRIREACPYEKDSAESRKWYLDRLEKLGKKLKAETEIYEAFREICIEIEQMLLHHWANVDCSQENMWDAFEEVKARLVLLEMREADRLKIKKLRRLLKVARGKLKRATNPTSKAE